MDPINLPIKYPFPEINVTVDCGGGRVNGPKVNINIINGAVDANKSDVRIEGEYHLHPFRAGDSPYTDEQIKAYNWIGAIVAALKSGSDRPYGWKWAGAVLAGAAYNVEFVNQVILLVSETVHQPARGSVASDGDPDGDNMAISIVVGFLRAMADVMSRTGEIEAHMAPTIRKLAENPDFCLAVGKEVMQEAK